jgi:hypothetical protein
MSETQVNIHETKRVPAKAQRRQEKLAKINQLSTTLRISLRLCAFAGTHFPFLFEPDRPTFT